MKKLIGLALILACLLWPAGCGRLPEAAEERISPVIGSDPSGAEGNVTAITYSE